MRQQFILFLLFINLSGLAQIAVVIEDFEGEKYPETQWGADNTHFGYYQVRYSMQIPGIYDSGIEDFFGSGKFAASYIYRYKINNILSIGAELGYENTSSIIIENYHSLFDTQHNYDKVRVYNNNIHTAAFSRFVLGDNTIRNLGWHLDLGAFYSYSFSRGAFHLKENNTEKIKLRQKNPDYLKAADYGIFLRIGKNNLMFYASCSFADWIYGLNNHHYKRTPLVTGIQINLYAK